MKTAMRGLIVLAVPLVLIVLTVRLLTWPWFPAWEYRRPGFPEDVYGLQRADRLRLARACITFLNLPHDVKRLERLRLPNGEPAFTAEEVQHMSDVKRVYDGVTTVGLLALVVGFSAGWALYRRGEVAALWGGLSDGALLTLVLLVALGGVMLFSWDAFFTGFHRVFFEEGTWRFRYSDTLIRLFPMRFWRDAGLILAGAVSLSAFVLALMGRMLQRRLEGRLS
ncbi:MAG: TIGR01906 family membrane protein [Anaerolineae bacterium]